jgi:hypothetical protein
VTTSAATSTKHQLSGPTPAVGRGSVTTMRMNMPDNVSGMCPQSTLAPSTSGANWRRGLRISAFLATCGLTTIVAAEATALRSQPCRSAGDLRLPSPDGRRELILYTRVCGERATGEVEIALKGIPVPDRPGNVDVPGHPLRTSARWISNDSVIIAIPRASALPKALQVNGVTITFSRLTDDR